jgi:hypothetical protein
VDSADKVAIQEVNHLYAYYIDLGQPDLWASEVFTNDAIFDERTFDSGLFVGRDAIRAFGEELTASVTHVVHHMTNHVIRPVDDDRATGTAFCICEVQAPGRRQRFNVIYQDEYRMVEGRWLIAKRVLVKTFDIENVDSAVAQSA